MGKFLFKVSYSPDGAKGVIESGGSARREAIAELAESIGGRLDEFYFALGEHDAYVVADLPDTEAAVAISFTANAAGATRVETIQLLTPEEIDGAAQRSLRYRAPGE